MITNPHDGQSAALVREGVRDDSPEGRRPDVRVRKGFTYADPDKEFDKLVQAIETRFVDVDAKLMIPTREGQYRQVHYPSLREMMAAPPIKKQVLDHLSGGDLRTLNEKLNDFARSTKGLREVALAKDKQLAELREKGHGKLTRKLREDAFTMGLYPDETSVPRNVFPIQDTLLPSTNSPYAKQQLWHDYLGAHAKAWEAATRNPLGKRIVRIIPAFVLGRGVDAKIKSAPHQEAWNDFARRNQMRWRLRQSFRELLIYGEIFLRYFKRPEGLVVRSLDPSTIWDVIHEPDDVESVLFYHQQYTLINTSPVPYVQWMPSKLIIRQIPASEIDHIRINCTTSEKRGRSELYAVLGWLLRFKEFMNDRILLNKMRAMFAIDVKVVEGDAADVADAERQFERPPGPGAVIVHNDTVELQFLNTNTNASDAKTDADMILKVIALGTGVSEQFLGVNSAGTRAQALISTEPDVKNFEEHQEMLEDVLHLMEKRAYRSKNLPDPDTWMEFKFPSLAQEDRSAKLGDLMKAEAMDYFSKRRAATSAASEFGYSNFDYDDEQAEIRRERSKDPVVAQGFQQVTKVAPDPTETPGLGQDLKPMSQPAGIAGPAGSKPTDAPESRVSNTSSQMGFSAKRLSGRGPANTQATLNRAEFTRAGEKTKLKTNRTSGTPLRNSAEGPRPRHVWSDAARVKALATRRANAERRKREQQG